MIGNPGRCRQFQLPFFLGAAGVNVVYFPVCLLSDFPVRAGRICPPIGIFHDSHADLRRVIDFQAIRPQPCLAANPAGVTISATLGTFKIYSDQGLFRSYLAPVMPLGLVIDEYRLESRPGEALVHVLVDHKCLHQLQHGFDAQ